MHHNDNDDVKRVSFDDTKAVEYLTRKFDDEHDIYCNETVDTI